jgi:predicted transcriptional regulator
MARKGGNPNLKGNKNSGRRTRAEEIKYAIEESKERITSEALVALANNLVYKKLEAIGRELEENGKESGLISGTKEFALPITLKGMTEQLDLTTKGKSLNIYAEQQIENIARRAISSSETPESERPN